MAHSDADYKFTFVDIGDYGSNSDGQAFMNNELDIPGPKFLITGQKGVYFHIVLWLMRLSY